MRDIDELFEERKGELLESLGRTDPGDPNYKYQTDNLKTLVDADNSICKTENERLNNNARNDMEQQRIEIELMKVQNERMKIRTGVVSEVLDLVKAGGFCWIAYHGEQVSYAIKNILSVATNYMKMRRR